jgi:excisionase family DNA binding protein
VPVRLPRRFNGGMNTAEHESEYLSVTDAARALDVAPITIRRKIETGELPAAQLGGPGSAVRIPRAGLEAWLWSAPQPDEEN